MENCIDRKSLFCQWLNIFHSVVVGADAAVHLYDSIQNSELYNVYCCLYAIKRNLN